MNDVQRDELLIRLDERLYHLTKMVTNHLSKHWAITLASFTAALAAIGGLLALILKLGP